MKANQTFLCTLPYLGQGRLRGSFDDPDRVKVGPERESGEGISVLPQEDDIASVVSSTLLSKFDPKNLRLDTRGDGRGERAFLMCGGTRGLAVDIRTARGRIQSIQTPESTLLNRKEKSSWPT